MRLCIHCSKNVESILRFWNTRYVFPGCTIEYTQNPVAECDIFVMMAEGGYNFKFSTTAPVRMCFTGEPACIYRYNPDFLRQFTHVVTAQDVKQYLPSTIVYNYQQCLCPLIGLKDGKFDTNEVTVTLGSTHKTKLLSAIVSNKCYTELHRKRRIFLERLKHDIPQLDLFGSGTGNQLLMKDLALREYQFSIAIENCSDNDYWTEKLSDCILSNCDVIYCGCRNISKYFDGITTIDIDDYEKSLVVIRQLIAKPVDEVAVRRRKEQYEQQYALLPTIRKILSI